jgi:uncharacterized protein with PQ loop repeat
VFAGDWIEAVGAVAGLLGLVGFVPQVVQTVRRGTAGDLNAATLVLFAVNTALWVLYGVAKQAWALAGSDGLILSFLGVLVGYKIADRMRGA